MSNLEHLAEIAHDWQYATVHWLALADEPPLRDQQPPYAGWMLNTDIAKRGREILIPAWSDGSIVQHRTYWRRHVPGVRHWQLKAHISVNRRPWWTGSNIPDRILNKAR
ncbi:hypothetical protein [Kribbella sindirgiensis]|uniref:Uncharacterized protein n=1 Tax=Kribbella sindirgiensis TaxID=1124744 RepID=A0A4R0IQ10_9ACTN|nr:hypothetical protein [Kribbella sindirgiensis]TCC35089.1 hypothetical protein E0H50_14570 [Kribbella sindirgiensis]